jgi:hypothetical protein
MKLDFYDKFVLGLLILVCILVMLFAVANYYINKSYSVTKSLRGNNEISYTNL